MAYGIVTRFRKCSNWALAMTEHVSGQATIIVIKSSGMAGQNTAIG
jgi:hypothetical protein